MTFLCGFASPKDDVLRTKYENNAYFTVYFGERHIMVTDEILRDAWYNLDSQRKFSNGENLWQRVKRLEANTKINEQNMKKHFPDVWQLVEKIRRETEVKPFNGHVQFNPNEQERFSLIGQRSGFDLDELKLYKDIISILRTGQHGNVVAGVKEIMPSSSEGVLKKIGLRGGYTTYFEQNVAREHNIELALKSFNGLVVQNGETVSFNKVVGNRSRDRGYMEAKIIIDGEFVPGVGGGVCQASTTMFNAAILAGLKIESSHNHSLAISYVPIGRDAMVSSSADLRFVNDTGGPIYIEAGVKNATEGKVGSAYVRIYGNKTSVTYKAKTEVIEHEMAEDEIDPARESKTYVEAWNGEKLVHKKLIRKSKYKAYKKV